MPRPKRPGSIHEGGELGYSLVHAYGAAFDNPELLVACVIGDGEAETGPLAGQLARQQIPQSRHVTAPCCRSCISTATRSPTPPSSPVCPARSWSPCCAATGMNRCSWRGTTRSVHQALAGALERAWAAISGIQRQARERGVTGRPRWPMIVLRTPKGWTGPKEVDGKPVEGTWRAHQVPLAGLASNPDHLRQLEEWLRSYRPEELFDGQGTFRPELAALAPVGDRRMGANPVANGGLSPRGLQLPDFRNYGVMVPQPGAVDGEATRVLGTLLRDVMGNNPDNFRLFGPDETASNRLDAVYEATDKAWTSGPPHRRAPLPGRAGDGGAERTPLPGLAGGLHPDRTARPLLVLRGVHPHRGLDVQPARQVAGHDPTHSLAAPSAVPEPAADLARVAAGPQRALTIRTPASLTMP